MSESDGTLVRCVRRGETTAFAVLYDRRARLVRALCYDTTGERQAAADLTQEVFLRAFQRLGRLRDPERFGVWIAGIARRVCREWRRGRVRGERCAAGLRRERTAAGEAPASAGLAGEDAGRVRQAVASLPEQERLALHAFYLQGLDAEQARAILGLSRSGLYRVLSSARRRLRRHLNHQEMPA